MDDTNKLLVSVDEAARMLGVSRAHLYPRVIRGELQSLRIGRSRRIPIAALERFVREQLAAGGDR